MREIHLVDGAAQAAPENLGDGAWEIGVGDKRDRVGIGCLVDEEHPLATVDFYDAMIEMVGVEKVDIRLKAVLANDVDDLQTAAVRAGGGTGNQRGAPQKQDSADDDSCFAPEMTMKC